MDYQKLADVVRLPKEEGYIGGYRIHTRHNKRLAQMSEVTGLSKMHCLELALSEYFEESKENY